MKYAARERVHSRVIAYVCMYTRLFYGIVDWRKGPWKIVTHDSLSNFRSSVLSCSCDTAYYDVGVDDGDDDITRNREIPRITMVTMSRTSSRNRVVPATGTNTLSSSIWPALLRRGLVPFVSTYCEHNQGRSDGIEMSLISAREMF